MRKKIKWKTDLEKDVLIDNFEKRGWQETLDDDWNVYWANVYNAREIFNPRNGFRLQDNQVLNHFPLHRELTRKDLLVKNMKRYRKELEKAKDPLSAKDENDEYIHLNFLPKTYILPAEYSLFVEEFHRNPHVTWIVKPAGRAQGKGIFLLRKIQQLKKICQGAGRNLYNTLSLKENYVISKYIDNPLLIGKKKFDLRMYVLVTSYKPLKIWVNKLGFARFTNENYNYDGNKLDDLYIHLTNDKYSQNHGGKFDLDKIRFYIEQSFGLDKAIKVFDDINNIFILSLKGVQNVVIADRHCFECYGFDVMIDENFKPWLIEVNASPSLTASTKADRIMKESIIDDVFKIVFPEDRLSKKSQIGVANIDETQIGNFLCIYDERNEIVRRKTKTIDKQRQWK